MNTILGIVTKYLDGRIVTRFVDEVVFDAGKYSGYSATPRHEEAITFVTNDPSIEMILKSIASESKDDLAETGRISVETTFVA